MDPWRICGFFNEEVVARSIHQSRIPVVSAVGHETDITIAILRQMSGRRLQTAAAEMVVPRLEELQIGLKAVQERQSKG